MTTYKELLKQREELEAQINAARKEEVAAAVANIRKLIADFGLTSEDVFPSTRAKATREAVAPKYRDPATGQTWTGRGKPPVWIRDQDRSKFAL